MTSKPTNLRLLSKTSQNFIRAVKKDIKDPKQAEIIEGVLKSALGGNKELADITSRMIRGELDDLKHAKLQDA